MPSDVKTSHDPVERITSSSTDSRRAEGQPYASETEDYQGSHLEKPRQTELDEERKSKK